MHPPGGTTGSASASWRSGTHVGRYRVHKLLARGGMGEIYVADFEIAPGNRHYRVLKRLIGATQGIPEQAQMFLDEGKLASQLRHPNIVTVHEVGTEAGTYYIAMEYLHGVDARAVLREVLMKGAKMPIDQAVRLGICACAGMHHAHELTTADGKPLQIVHRDISPQNLFLTFDGEVKLLDFGVARSNRHDRETTTRGLKGKIPYMSPEQCLSRPIDRRSDIFSLGIILFELTVGSRLFRGNSDYELMQQIVTGEVVPPSALDPQFPAALESIILKALKKPSDKRYQTALEMERELEAFGLASGLDLGAAAMARFLHDTFGAVPEAWAVPDDAAERAARSGPMVIERGGPRQTVQMPQLKRPTPAPMRPVSGTTPPSGSALEQPPASGDTMVAEGASHTTTTAPRPDPAGQIVTDSDREPSGRWRHALSGRTARAPSGRVGTATVSGREDSSQRAHGTPGANPSEGVGGTRDDRTEAAASRDGSGPARSGVSAAMGHPIISSISRSPVRESVEPPRQRRRALAAAGVFALVLAVGVGLSLATRDSSSGSHPRSGDGAGSGTGATRSAKSPLRVTESPEAPTSSEGYGNVIITASQRRASFLVDGKKVSGVAPFQLDHLDVSRPHTLEASLGPGRPTVLQRFVVVPGETMILNVRFDASGGGSVGGNEAAMANGPVGSIRVESTPACEVVIDGKRAGASPIKLRVAVGTHHVTLEPPDGGQPRSVDVKVSEGRVVVVSGRF